MFERVAREQGRLDVLVNNAFSLPSDLIEAKPFWQKPLSNWEMVDVGVRWGFESFGEYLALLRRQGAYPNVAAYASHSTIRTVVMGAESSQRAATPGDRTDEPVAIG